MVYESELFTLFLALGEKFFQYRMFTVPEEEISSAQIEDLRELAKKLGRKDLLSHFESTDVRKILFSQKYRMISNKNYLNLRSPNENSFQPGEQEALVVPENERPLFYVMYTVMCNHLHDSDLDSNFQAPFGHYLLCLSDPSRWMACLTFLQNNNYDFSVRDKHGCDLLTRLKLFFQDEKVEEELQKVEIFLQQ